MFVLLAQLAGLSFAITLAAWFAPVSLGAFVRRDRADSAKRAARGKAICWGFASRAESFEAELSAKGGSTSWT